MAFGIMQAVSLLAYVAIAVIIAPVAGQTNVSCGTVNVNGYPVDLTQIPTGFFTLNQIYNGAQSPYVWAFSFCNPLPATKIYPKAIACRDDPVYAAQLGTKSGACEAGVNVFAAEPVVNGGTVTFNYSVNCPLCRYTMYEYIVNVECGASATPAAASPNVVVTGNFPALIWTFNVQVNTLCPPPPPPPTPSGIEIAVYAKSQSCEGAHRVNRLHQGCSMRAGNTSSLYFCVDGVLHWQSFATSGDCSGEPTSVHKLAPTQCQSSIIGSEELLRCT